MKKIFLRTSLFIIIFHGLATSVQACTPVTLDKPRLEQGEHAVINVNGHEVIIYRRTNKQIEDLNVQSAGKWDDKIPGWWPRKKLPVSRDLSEKVSRSRLNNYFVAWNVGPVYGYNLLFFPDPTLRLTQKASWPAFLGSDWRGGFVDVVNMVAYDFNGRVHMVDSDVAERNPVGDLNKVPLLIPGHEFNEEETQISFRCVEF